MKQSYIYITLLVLLVLGLLFGVSNFLSKDSVAPNDANPIVKEERPITITAKHQYKDGTHIVAGETDMPTPCHLLDHQTMIAESFPEQVTINFTLGTTADACAQVITPARFKVEFTASEGASIEATLNGKPVILNLVEVSPDEDLDDFELFIKG